MARSDGRIESGQRLTSAISARAWNRAQEAADLVLGRQPAVQGGPVNVLSLPCVKVRLPSVGNFGEVRVLDNAVDLVFPGSSSSFIEPSASLSEFTEAEQKIVSFLNVDTVLTSYLGPFPPDRPNGKLFICVGNNDNIYAVSGFAVTRVRMWNIRHRYARPPVASGGTSGTLDSAFWGPAEIAGYFKDDGTPGVGNATGDQVVFDEPVYRWALVCL